MTAPSKSSSFIQGVSYNERTKVLTVYMLNGSAYTYTGVSRRTKDKVRWAGVRNGWSIGEAYNRLVKGQYLCAKVA
jgi:hypothetical protein